MPTGAINTIQAVRRSVVLDGHGLSKHLGEMRFALRMQRLGEVLRHTSYKQFVYDIFLFLRQ